uniref:Uncharacterized protein n=1 Tax=Bracon brevicornis TaxID=1563983 RepID=A0A6V7HZ84_9HYME
MSAADHSYTGGVKPMTITGRMIFERERCIGMSAEERAWRAQWLKDQVLAPDEPKFNPEYYKQRYNILRRFYRAPMDRFERALTPKIGLEFAQCCRHLISKTFFTVVGSLCVLYYFKYNQSDWTRKSGLKVSMSRQKMFPGDPGFPNYATKTDREYASFGFEKSPL